MRNSQPCRRSRGFTLVELLVVIGIIALLIGILLPALSKARKKAQEAACASNLHQMGLAMSMYVSDWKVYPGNIGLHDGVAMQTISIWQTRLRGYMNGNYNAFFCPSEDESFRWTTAPMLGNSGSPFVVNGVKGFYADASDSGFGYNYKVVGRAQQGEPILFTAGNFNGGQPANFSYGYNDWGIFGTGYGPYNEAEGLGGNIGVTLSGADATVQGPVSHELKAARVRMPAEMIAISDRVGSVDISTGKPVVTQFNYNIDPTNKTEWPSNIHHGGSNVLFADGHVTWVLQYELLNVDAAGPGPDGLPLLCPGHSTVMPTTGANGMRGRLIWNTSHSAFPDAPHISTGY